MTANRPYLHSYWLRKYHEAVAADDAERIRRAEVQLDGIDRDWREHQDEYTDVAWPGDPAPLPATAGGAVVVELRPEAHDDHGQAADDDGAQDDHDEEAHSVVVVVINKPVVRSSNVTAHFEPDDRAHVNVRTERVEYCRHIPANVHEWVDRYHCAPIRDDWCNLLFGTFQEWIDHLIEHHARPGDNVPSGNGQPDGR